MRNTNSAKLWAFRLVAFGGSSCICLSLAAWFLSSQERLVVDLDKKTVRLRPGPIYLEEPGHEVTGHRYLFDERLGWRNIPNWKASTRGNSLSINSKGLRDREYSYEKPASVKRILVLGDSFAWGYGVSDEEIFSEVLETHLEETPTSWEVINSGVSGWGTDQEFLYLLEEGFRYQPDVVILAFFVVNDIWNNQNALQYGLSKPVFMDENLTLAEFPVPKPTEQVAIGRTRADPFDLTMAIIHEMSHECATHDAELIVAKFGMFLEPDYDVITTWNTQLGEAMSNQDRSFLYLDLDDEYAKKGIHQEQLLEGNDDGHWNAFGHQQTAEILLEFMNEQGVLTLENKSPLE